jgi:hypothetical protein
VIGDVLLQIYPIMIYADQNSEIRELVTCLGFE